GTGTPTGTGTGTSRHTPRRTTLGTRPTGRPPPPNRRPTATTPTRTGPGDGAFFACVGRGRRVDSARRPDRPAAAHTPDSTRTARPAMTPSPAKPPPLSAPCPKCGVSLRFPAHYNKLICPKCQHKFHRDRPAATARSPGQ